MQDPLSRLLSLYPASVRPLAPPVALGNAGGLSGAMLWRFASGLGPLVARAWPVDGPAPAALARIHGWLGRLADLDFVPIPLATLDGRTFVPIDGLSWEIAPWRPGEPDRADPPVTSRIRAAFAGLAALHQRLAFDSAVGPSPGLKARLEEAEAWLSADLDRLGRAIRPVPDDPTAGPALRWIALAREGLPGVADRLRRSASIDLTIQPTLRDARREHFLFEGDRLTGLVDFGAMGWESPASDLARLLAEWVGIDRTVTSEALDAYASIRPIPPAEAARIESFAESAAWLGPARWARWHFLEGRRFSDPAAVAGGLDRALGRLLARVEDRALRS